LNKKSIVYLLVFALVAVACATEAAEEEVTVEDDHDHEMNQLLNKFKKEDSLSVVFQVLQLLSLRHKLTVL